MTHFASAGVQCNLLTAPVGAKERARRASSGRRTSSLRRGFST